MRKLKKTVFAFIILYIALNLALIPSKCTEAARGAILLCLNIAIPSLFPFFVISALFITLGYAGYLSRFFSPVMRSAFNVSGAGAAAVILGIISGYPVGAASCVSLYKSGQISKTEAERLLAFSNNSGPIFIIGALGAGILSSKSTGYMLYLSHIAAALLVGFVFRSYKKNAASPAAALPPARGGIKNDFGGALAESINSSVISMAKVCGFIILFSVICAAIPSGRFYPYIYSLLEITGGLNALSKVPIDSDLRLCLVSFFLGFSGISVFCQAESIIRASDLSIKTCFFGKLLQGIFSFFITKILIKHFAEYTPVSSVASDFYGAVLPKSVWQASLSIILFALLLVIFLLFIGYLAELKRK